MKINYTMLFIIMFGIFIVNKSMNNGFTYENLLNITEQSSGDITKNPTNPSIQEKIKETIVAAPSIVSKLCKCCLLFECFTTMILRVLQVGRCRLS